MTIHRKSQLITPLTVPMTEDGPLYPPEPIPRRADLTNGGRANGELFILMGVIYNHQKIPVKNAIVEIWQADSLGYYDHPRARGPEAMDEYWHIERQDLDPNFAYFGSVKTDANGVYWFKTVIPRWYKVFNYIRAAHVHIKVWSKNNGVFTTEVYFPGDEQESVRASDKVFAGRRQKSKLMVRFFTRKDKILEGVPSDDLLKYARRDIYFM
ncbi:MAG: hypothetical protein AAGB12_12385 [Pseudomonadota bacterium]